MGAKQTIIWAIVELVIGVTLGFGFRAPIASTLNLEALQGPGTGTWGKPLCTPPKIWTGNGCADPRTWTLDDWLFFSDCLTNAMSNPPPPLPDHAITDAEYANCAKQTEGGKGR